MPTVPAFRAPCWARIFSIWTSLYFTCPADFSLSPQAQQDAGDALRQRAVTGNIGLFHEPGASRKLQVNLPGVRRWSRLGCAAGWQVVHFGSATHGPRVGGAVAFSAAAPLYLVTEELLMEAHTVEEKPFSTLVLFGGFLAFWSTNCWGDETAGRNRAASRVHAAGAP
jgi:hypothetical protein